MALIALCAAPSALAANGDEFKYNGIKYTVISEAGKTCETKRGESYAGNLVNGDIVIPETVYNGDIAYTVVKLGWNAFSGCTGLTSVSLPNSITEIGYWAFSGCSNLTSVNIPTSVTYIPYSTFYQCCSLTSIEIPNSVKAIDDLAFYECSGLTSISIPNSVTRIGEEAFRRCSGLTSVDIPNSVTSIGEYAFRECTSLTSIVIPTSVTSFARWVFYGCSSLTSVVLPNSMTLISEGTFHECTSLTSIDIPNSVTEIGQQAFYECSGLTSISIPNSVTSIGHGAFEWCIRLQEVILGNSLEYLDSYVFSGSNAVTKIYSYSENPPFCHYRAFGDINKETCTLYVPVQSLGKYKTADQWKEFYNIQAIVEEIHLDKTEATIKVGETLQLTATVLPEEAAGAVLTWSSSDESIATVSATGLVSAVSLGTATITVSSGNISVTCTIEVSEDAGVDGVLVDGNDNVEVYTLQGVRLDVSTREELSKLIPGFYIVNGKKVYVK